QLREIFDRINIVMRRRADEPDARRRMTDFSDVFVNLMPGKLPAFAGLGALRHLDLKLGGVDEIFRRDTESRARDLFDRAAAPDQRRLRAGVTRGLIRFESS